MIERIVESQNHWWGEYKDLNTGVTKGELCKECSMNKDCKDIPCPLYKFMEK